MFLEVGPFILGNLGRSHWASGAGGWVPGGQPCFPSPAPTPPSCRFGETSISRFPSTNVPEPMWTQTDILTSGCVLLPTVSVPGLSPWVLPWLTRVLLCRVLKSFRMRYFPQRSLISLSLQLARFGNSLTALPHTGTLAKGADIFFLLSILCIFIT